MSEIVVSAKAYSAVELMKKAMDSMKTEFVKFPEGDYNKFQIQKELIDKKVIKKNGVRKDALFTLSVPYENVKKSARTYGVSTKGLKTQAPAVSKSPVVSRGGYKPPFQVLADFVKAVENESREIAKGKNDELEARIGEMSQALAKTKNKDERNRFIQELSKANDALHSLSSASTIEAVKNCSAMPAFRQYNLDDIVSVDPSDYFNE